MNPHDLKPGDIIDDGSPYPFSLHFVEAVYPSRIHFALLYTPHAYTHPKTGEVSTYYTKLAGHDSMIPFEDTGKSSDYARSWIRKFWAKKWKRHGSLPALVGQKQIKLSGNPLS